MRRDVFLLSAAAFASSASLRATDPLLPLIADDFGVTPGAAATAATAFALAYGLLQVIYGPLGDRYGRYRMIAATAFASAFCSAACAIAPDLPSLVVARFVSGATIGAFIPLSVAWIGDTFAYAQRQSLLARYLIGQIVGIGFGTALAGWMAEHFGWRAIFALLAAVLLVLSVFLALEARRQPRPATRPSMLASFARMPRLLKRWALASIIVTAFCEGFFIFGARAFVALYFQRQFAVGPATAGTLVALYALGGMVYATVAPRALRAFGEIGLATIGGIALALGYGILAASPWLGVAALGLIAIGGGFYMFHTTVQTKLTEVEQKERGSAVALFATFLFTGQAIGLAVASRLVDAVGIASVFWCSTVGLAAVAFAFRRRLLSLRRAP